MILLQKTAYLSLFILMACTQPNNKLSYNENNIQLIPQKNTELRMEKIIIETKDQLQMTADLYRHKNEKAPIIILCHQAGYSRGEYIETAPKLVDMGYHCLALDQRSGSGVNNIVNETTQKAKEKNLGTQYIDALPDIEGALNYALNNFPGSKIMIVGSSYSSSLAILMAANFPEDIEAIACFSPGNYFTHQGLNVSDYALKVECPAFITSAKNEGGAWKSIFENIPNSSKTSFLPNSSGFHGSKALWSESPGNEEYWKAFSEFLNKNFPS